MIQLLIDNSLLLLFLVAAIGYPLGRIAIRGSSLGVAAVLFVGLAFGALDPNLKLPDLVYELGLVVFVYTIGLSSGRQFFASFRSQGLRDNLMIVGMLIGATGLTLVIGRLLKFSPALTSGIFTGSMTNTAALAGVLEHVKATASGPDLERTLAEPVIGFSIAYPMGVIGMIIVMTLLRRWWKVDFAKEAAQLRSPLAPTQKLHNRTIIVTRPEAIGATINEMLSRQSWDVILGRVRHDDRLVLANGQMRLALGDLVSVIGP
ncbi:MAG: transporter, partial [Herpetosiphonaceae bacterium]|nr:transporter [Herpetosiphonaceae bacterium]